VGRGEPGHRHLVDGLELADSWSVDGHKQGGTCWMGGSHRRGRRYMRIAVSNWSTTEADVDRSVAAIAAIMASPRS